MDFVDCLTLREDFYREPRWGSPPPTHPAAACCSGLCLKCYCGDWSFVRVLFLYSWTWNILEALVEQAASIGASSGIQRPTTKTQKSFNLEPKISPCGMVWLPGGRGSTGQGVGFLRAWTEVKACLCSCSPASVSRTLWSSRQSSWCTASRNWAKCWGCTCALSSGN